MRAGLLCLGVMLALVRPLWAQDRAAQLEALFTALDITRTIEVMHDEGLVHGDSIARDMLPAFDAAGWSTTVRRIYSKAPMQRLIEEEMALALAETDLGPLVAFFTSPTGQEIVRLEIEARRALMEPETEEAANLRLEKAVRDRAPLVTQVEAIIADSDLIERNVMGALNSNMMFYKGLIEGGAWDMSEDDMLREIWSQEEETRAETEEWLMAFLVMAYAPVATRGLDDYAALYRSPEGKALNRALFQAFNRMYDELSYLLGRAVAEQLTSAPL
jgi:hypothetical protein